MPAGVVHVDDVKERVYRLEGLKSGWTDLGEAAGSVEVGLNRIRIPEGERSTPPHRHAAEEEIFYVLSGQGLSWQDGATFPVAAGDCLVHLAAGPVHTLVGGPGGLEVLAFGERLRAELCLLPRAGVAFLGHSWVDAGEEQHPWRRDAAVGPLEVPDPGPRPTTVANVAAVEPVAREGATVSRTRRDLGEAIGSVRTGLKHVTSPAGALGAPPHCHAVEEELFYVLAGDGTLVLGDDEHPIRAGHTISRPAGTGVAHAVRAGSSGLTLLAYGTRRPDDACYYPRSGKVFLRGLGVIGRIQPLDYWDGED